MVSAFFGAGLMACTLSLPYISRLVIDQVIRGHQHDKLAPLLWIAFGLILVRFVLNQCRRIWAGRISLGVEYDLRDAVFGHIQRLSFAFFDRMPVGQLMSRATNDLQVVRFFLGYGVVFVFMNTFQLVVICVVLFWINATLAAVSLLVGPALLAVAIKYSRTSSPVRIDVQQKAGEVAQAAEESVVGIRVIKAFGREQYRTSQFSEVSTRAFRRNMDAARLESFYSPLLSLLPVFGLAVILAYGGTMVIHHTLTLGQFVQFYLYLALLMGPFQVIAALLGNGQRAVAGGRRIFEILDAVPDVREPDDPQPFTPGPGEITFEGVRFSYDGSRDVLHGIDLTITAGTTVALIGMTGAGKSTLTELIPRYYEVTEGSVSIDGIDVRRLALNDLRREIGVVSQEPFLFSSTVRENIAYGRPDARDDQVRNAAELARAAAFIDELPNGYDTVVGERGYTLSGGQRQRLAIARAVLTDPRILILDEATASVDASTERDIQAALRAVMEGRTTIIIAHRLSTIRLADELILIDHGAIAARGQHRELYAQSELYRTIHDSGLARPDLVLGDV